MLDISELLQTLRSFKQTLHLITLKDLELHPRSSFNKNGLDVFRYILGVHIDVLFNRKRAHFAVTNGFSLQKVSWYSAKLSKVYILYQEEGLS